MRTNFEFYEKMFVFGFVWSVTAVSTYVTLQNAAEENLKMPISGLGTGGYGNNQQRALGE